MTKIRVLIVDDHAIFRESLRSFLNAAEDIEVVGEAGDGIEAVHEAAQLRPDVVLMDLAMPNVNGLQATRQIKRKNPSMKVLILTMYENEQYITEMLRSKASGYIPKRAPASELISGIRAVSQGEAYLYPSVAKKVLDGYLEQIEAGEKVDKEKHLTDRELEVLYFIAEGKTNKGIAKSLNISLHTVQTHRLNLMTKLQAHDRTQLVRYAIREGLIIP